MTFCQVPLVCVCVCVCVWVRLCVCVCYITPSKVTHFGKCNGSQRIHHSVKQLDNLSPMTLPPKKISFARIRTRESVIIGQNVFCTQHLSQPAVMSYMNESCHIWRMRHVTHGKSHVTCKCVLHIQMCFSHTNVLYEQDL